MINPPLRQLTAIGILLTSATGCKPPAAPSPAPETTATADVCSNTDGALNDASFIFVTSPLPGEIENSGFKVTGCSRTFESTVNWKLKARDGRVLASGHTTGGGVDGAAAFAFAVDFQITERQIGHLEVEEEDASDGEGNPPPRNVIPLVLLP